MPYSIHEIEVTQPLPTLTLSESDTGVGLIVRRYDRAIGFLMQSWNQPQISTDTIAAWIAEKLSAKIIQEAIRDEWGGSEISHHPSLTVAICTKDRPDQLVRCLNSLLKLQSDRFEIVVIDNAPTDDRTQALIATLPTVRYVRESKAGLNFARNRALEVANTELLAFLDDDVVVDRLWFDGLITAWVENPDAAAWTGLVLPYELETEAQILFESRGGFGRGFEKIRYGQILPQNPLYPCGAGIFGAGCNMAFRREILLKLGGFDEALDTGAPLPGGGDLDIFYRTIRSNNVLVYEPQYLVYHQHRREIEKLRRQYWSWGLGLMAFVGKSYQSDPAQRKQLQELVKWWFQHQSKQLFKSWLGRHPLPPEMILAEIWGGIRGLLSEYPRSQHRIEQIRRQYESI
jgi:glycosyltransferase involved in cell wall biosynthesis